MGSTLYDGHGAERRALYAQHMAEWNLEGSNKAASYVRALDLLGPVLSRHVPNFAGCPDLWSISDTGVIRELYPYIIEQQKLGSSGIFGGEEPSSYWRSGFYSAALKSYQSFLAQHCCEQGLWSVYSERNLTPEVLARKLSEEGDAAADVIVADEGWDVGSREGKEILREVKTRLNQSFFRRMVLAEYGTACCVTRLSVPHVLRASHIVGWAEDEENRLNPANGLCLSATLDAAFDRHLLSLDEDYRLVFSPALKAYCDDAAYQTQFGIFEGTAIALPKHYRPDQKLLAKHRDRMLRA